ncbi:hypothetical protein DENSPDRAFT_882479 [Dentipellis sp. KUC8613]|nr:hypothetical protein DENSPDRAFT_882479 [Dentipellis sp. KUC8613]
MKSTIVLFILTVLFTGSTLAASIPDRRAPVVEPDLPNRRPPIHRPHIYQLELAAAEAGHESTE